MIDATGPVISNMSPANGTTINSNTIELTADIYDALWGIGATTSQVAERSAIYLISSSEVAIIDGSQSRPAVTSLGDGRWKISNGSGITLDDGVYTWFVWVTDGLSNVTWSSTYTLTVDTD